MTALLAAAAPHLASGGDLGISYVRVALALLACCVIAAAAILLLRHRAGRRLALALPRATSAERCITVVESRRVSPHADVCLVAHDGREWLLVVQPTGVHVLSGPSCA